MPRKPKPQRPTWKHAKRTGVRMTAHPNGQWVKRVDGKLKSFGSWRQDPDGDAALESYLQAAERLLGGVDVKTSPRGIVTVADVFNAYLAEREPDVNESRVEGNGRDRSIGPAMFMRYTRAGKAVAAVVGRGRRADTLTPEDFAAIKSHLEEQMAVPTMSGYLTAIKAVFTHGYDSGLMDAPPRFGPNFQARGMKRATRMARRERGKKLLDAATVRALMAGASPQVFAMIHLGINCGFYSIDCSDLTRADVDLERGVVSMARYKTQVDRVCPLWPETVEAVAKAIEVRPAPKDPAHAGRVFLTRTGKLWTATQRANYNPDGTLKSVVHNCYASQELRRLFIKADIERPVGCGFSWLRHTFYTIARRTRDYDAVNAIMGHTAGGMIEHYLEDVDLAELRAVTDHVRAWLFGGQSKKRQTRRGA